MKSNNISNLAMHLVHHDACMLYVCERTLVAGLLCPYCINSIPTNTAATLLKQDNHRTASRIALTKQEQDKH